MTRAVEHVEGGEQGGGAVALVVVGHGAGAALLHAAGRAGCGRAPGSGSSRRPTAPRHGPAGRRRGRRCRAASAANCGIVGELEGADAVRLQAVRPPDPLHRGDADAGRLGHRAAGPVGRLAAAARSRSAPPPGRPPPGRAAASAAAGSCRAAARRRPASAKRSCQRQTQVLRLARPAHDLDGAEPVRRQQHDLGPPDMLLRAVAVRRRSPPGGGDRRR